MRTKREKLELAIATQALNSNKPTERVTKRHRQKNNEIRVTLKIPEAALIAGCGDRSIREGVRQGIIPHIKFGRNILIPKSAFMRFLDTAGGTAK